MIIDVHTHTLPGIDDGSRDVAMSLAMLTRQKEMGVEIVCGTSHYYRRKGSIEEFLARRNKAYLALEKEKPEDLPLVLPGAEVAFFLGISEEPDIGKLCLYGTRTLLVEMPFAVWTKQQIEEIRVLSMDRQFDVVLVHPERFVSERTNKEFLSTLVTLPIVLQVNAQTLISWRTRSLGLELLRMTDAGILGSDSHNLDRRPPNLDKARQILLKHWGESGLTHMDHVTEHLVAPKE